MNPKTKAAIDAAKKRLADAQKRIDAISVSDSATATAAAEETKTVGAVPADVARRIEVLERTVREFEGGTRERLATAAETKAFTAKAPDSACLGIDGNRFSIVKALLARNDFKHMGRKAFEHNRAEYERDALEAYYGAVQRETGKTMTFGDESSGGFLVPPEVRAPIDALRSATWMDKLPVTKYPGLTYAPVIIPRQTSDNTSYWVSEGTSTSTSDPTLDQIALNPKILANGTKLSLHLMRKSPGTAEKIARRSIAESMARKMELGLIEGASGGPTGLDNFSGIGSVAFTSDNGNDKQVNVNQMILELIQDNVPTEGAMFLMSEKVWANLHGVLFIDAGTAAADRASAMPMTNFAWVDPSGQKYLKGFKVVTTNNLTVSTTGLLYFGQWKHMIVADWGAAEMSMTTEGQTLALARQALITTFQEVDSQLEHASAFCKGTAYTVALT